MFTGNVGDIVTFVAAADVGSFVAAARMRGITRSGVAKSIARIEDRLGVRLFNRTTRSLSMTDEGRAYHARCVQILADLEEAERSLAPDGGGPHGLLRLTAPAVLGRLRILPIVNEYLEAWPDLRIEASFSDRMSDIIEDGFDLAIRIVIGRADASGGTRLVTRNLAEQHHVICGAPAYLEEYGVPIEPDDLMDHRCISYSSGGRRLPWRFMIGNVQTDLNLRARLALDSGEALRDAAVAGSGLAYLPSYLVDDDLKQGRLTTVLTAFAMPPQPIVALYPSRKHLAPKVRRFIDLVALRLR